MILDTRSTGVNSLTRSSHTDACVMQFGVVT